MPLINATNYTDLHELFFKYYSCKLVQFVAKKMNLYG